MKCPNCGKPNCGNWAACARRAQAAQDAQNSDKEWRAKMQLMWIVVGTVEAVYQHYRRDPFSLGGLMLIMNGPEETKRRLAAEVLLAFHNSR